MPLVFSHWVSGWDKGFVKMKKSLTSQNSEPDLSEVFRCASLSLMSRLNVTYLPVPGQGGLSRDKKKPTPGASLILVFRTSKQLLLLFVNHAARSDSQLTKEVPVQVDQNKNKAGVRSSNEERTDPNNGPAMAWQGMRSDSGASHSLFIAARSWVRYLFFSAAWAAKDHGTKTSRQSRLIHVTVSREAGEANGEGGSEVTARCRRPGWDLPWLLLTASLLLPLFPLSVIDAWGQC